MSVCFERACPVERQRSAGSPTLGDARSVRRTGCSRQNTLSCTFFVSPVSTFHHLRLQVTNFRTVRATYNTSPFYANNYARNTFVTKLPTFRCTRLLSVCVATRSEFHFGQASEVHRFLLHPTLHQGRAIQHAVSSRCRQQHLNLKRRCGCSSSISTLITKKRKMRMTKFQRRCM